MSVVTGVITTAIQSLQEALKTTINDLVSAKLTTYGVPQNIHSVPELGDKLSLPKDAPEDLAFKIADEYRDREIQKLDLIFRIVLQSQAEESTSRAADDIKLVYKLQRR